MLAAKIQPCEGEGRQRDDHQHNGGGGHGEHQRVQEVASQRHGGEGVVVVLQRGGQGEECGDALGAVGAVALYGGQHHPVEGEQHDHRPQRQQHIGDGAAHRSPAARGQLELLIIGMRVHSVASSQ